ncbi:MAG: V-type ATP synthase subunit F [Clostridia bacterium]|nr:V-type ATP synthase subunit F [Clostridia bacterium]
MYKIAAVGDRDSIFSYAAVGISVFPAETPQDAVARIRELAGAEYAVIFITEKLAAGISAELDKYRNSPVPAIIPIPGIGGSTGLGMENVSKAVEKAVGSDIIN